MAAKTRFGLEGYGVRRAGSFADKTVPPVVKRPVAMTASLRAGKGTGTVRSGRATSTIGS